MRPQALDARVVGLVVMSMVGLVALANAAWTSGLLPYTVADALEVGTRGLDVPETTSVMKPEDTMLVRVESTRTLVSLRVDSGRTIPVDGTPAVDVALICKGEAEEIECLEKTVEATKDRMRKAKRPYDPVVTVAMDRCLPMSRLLRTLRSVEETEIYKVKLVAKNDGEMRLLNGSGGVVRWSWEDGGLNQYVELHLGQAGVTVMIDGVPVPPLEGCPGNGPTVCAAREAVDCGDRRQDWARLRDLLIDRVPDEQTLYLLQAAPDVSFQSVVSLMDAIRWVDSSNPTTDSDNELLPDPVLYYEPLEHLMLPRTRPPIMFKR